MPEMTQESVIRLMKGRRILRNGHFVLRGGQHTDTYMDKRMLNLHPTWTKDMCWFLGDKLFGLDPDRYSKVQMVIGLAEGGKLLAHWISYHFNSVFAAKYEVLVGIIEEQADENEFVFRHGYEKYVDGRQVLVVGTTLTTGGKTRKAVRTIEAAGGKVLGAAYLWNRGNLKAEKLRVPEIVSLVEMKLLGLRELSCWSQ